jgi:hypothetical protein
MSGREPDTVCGGELPPPGQAADEHATTAAVTANTITAAPAAAMAAFRIRIRSLFAVKTQGTLFC